MWAASVFSREAQQAKGVEKDRLYVYGTLHNINKRQVVSRAIFKAIWLTLLATVLTETLPVQFAFTSLLFVQFSLYHKVLCLVVLIYIWEKIKCVVNSIMEPAPVVIHQNNLTTYPEYFDIMDYPDEMMNEVRLFLIEKSTF